MIYWDTSCLLKLYVHETDSPVYLDLLKRQKTPIITSVLAEVEFVFALSRKEADGCLKKGATLNLTQAMRNHAAQGKIRLVPISAAVRDLAATLAHRCLLAKNPLLPLRTLDGIHLATALSLKATGLLTADTRLRDAARLCGFATSE